MIRIRVTRVEDTGAETDLGEVRMAELGAVASYRETADGAGVMRDVRAALACLSPDTLRAVRFEAAKQRVFSAHADLLRRLS